MLETTGGAGSDDAGQLRLLTLATALDGSATRRRLWMELTQRRWASEIYRRFLEPWKPSRQVTHIVGGIGRRTRIGTRPFEVQMKRLNFIHFARWYVVAGLPKREPHGKIVFFVTNFDREARPYIEAFVEAFDEGGLATQWGDAPGWPKGEATVAKLVRFAGAHAVPPMQPVAGRPSASHSFKAYHTPSTVNVRSALHVHREVRAFALEYLDRPGSERSPEAWETGFYTLLGSIQSCLGSMATGDVHDLAPVAAQPQRTRSFLVLAPFAKAGASGESAREQMAELIDRCETGRSPFADVPGTHTGRLAILDAIFDYETRTYRSLRHAYLLCSAEFRATNDEDRWGAAVAEYLQRLVEANPMLWERVGSFNRRTDTLLNYLTTRRQWLRRTGPLYEPAMEYIDYPHVEPHQVVEAIRTHRELGEFLRIHLGSAQMRETFEATFAGEHAS